MNVIIKGVSYTEKRAKELGIHPDQKKKKKVENPPAGKKEENNSSFDEKVSEKIVKK